MRHAALLVLFVALATHSFTQDDADGPSNEKAKKTYRQALELVQQHRAGPALDYFKKADKQDDGHCVGCQKKMVQYGIQFGDWKVAETAGEEMVAEAHSAKSVAVAHYELGRY